MRINVSQLLKETIGSVRDYEINSTVDINGDGSSSTVRGKLNLMRTDRGILANASLNTSVEISCSRCLNLFSHPLELNILEEYFPVLNISSGAPLPPPDEPDSFTIDEHHVLDLTEAVRQYGLIAIPMKPLCRKDCIGLKDKP